MITSGMSLTSPALGWASDDHNSQVDVDLQIRESLMAPPIDTLDSLMGWSKGQSAARAGGSESYDSGVVGPSIVELRKDLLLKLQEQLRKLQDQVSESSQLPFHPQDVHSRWDGGPLWAEKGMTKNRFNAIEDLEPISVSVATANEAISCPTIFDKVGVVFQEGIEHPEHSMDDGVDDTKLTYSSAELLFTADDQGQDGRIHNSDDAKSHFMSRDHSSTVAPSANRFRHYQADQWSTMLDELLAYQKENGHCRVSHVSKKWPALGRWVKRQRYQHRLMLEGREESTMTPERAAVLERVGFLWDSHNSTWQQRYSELNTFFVENGHTNVPSDYPANPRLSTWVKFQRRSYKTRMTGRVKSSETRGNGVSHCNMTMERIQALEAIGFQWELRKRRSG